MRQAGIRFRTGAVLLAAGVLGVSGCGGDSMPSDDAQGAVKTNARPEPLARPAATHQECPPVESVAGLLPAPWVLDEVRTQVADSTDVVSCRYTSSEQVQYVSDSAGDVSTTERFELVLGHPVGEVMTEDDFNFQDAVATPRYVDFEGQNFVVTAYMDADRIGVSFSSFHQSPPGASTPNQSCSVGALEQVDLGFEGDAVLTDGDLAPVVVTLGQWWCGLIAESPLG